MIQICFNKLESEFLYWKNDEFNLRYTCYKLHTINQFDLTETVFLRCLPTKLVKKDVMNKKKKTLKKKATLKLLEKVENKIDS